LQFAGRSAAAWYGTNELLDGALGVEIEESDCLGVTTNCSIEIQRMLILVVGRHKGRDKAAFFSGFDDSLHEFCTDATSLMLWLDCNIIDEEFISILMCDRDDLGCQTTHRSVLVKDAVKPELVVLQQQSKPSCSGTGPLPKVSAMILVTICAVVTSDAFKRRTRMLIYSSNDMQQTQTKRVVICQSSEHSGRL
jgi:hypothetical protein